MITHAYGELSLEDLMQREGLSAAFATRQQKLADFLPTFLNGLPGFAARAGETADLAALQQAVSRIQSDFTDVLVFGTGGSSLGAQAAMGLVRYRPHSGVTIHTPDSLDPFEMERLFTALNPAKTHVLAISKSGTTAETLAQLLTTRSWLDAHINADKIADHFTFITEPGPRPLRTYAEKLGAPVLDHPTDVGGRFSVLTVVGMLPAALAGLDIAAFRQGAADMLNTLRTKGTSAMPAEGAAFIDVLADARKMDQTLIMPYADALRAFTRWHGQLWAESVGKDGKGTTPIRAIGPVDQHSQLQLFLDGPNNRSVTLITLPSYGKGPVVDADEARAYGLDYMAGRSIGDTITCQARATGNTFRNRGRLVRDITIDALDETHLGGLFMSFMIETALISHLMGINAYDQPAVEEGKILTRDYLNALGAPSGTHKD